MPSIATASNAPTKQSSPILALPYEVRAMIWEYALMSPSQAPQTVVDSRGSFQSLPVTISDPHDIYVTVDDESMHSSDSRYWGKEPMTRLLRVSKILNAEAKAVLYSKFGFTFGCSSNKTYVEAKCFLAIIGRDAQALIRRITVAFPADIIPTSVFTEDTPYWPPAEDNARAPSLFRASLPALSEVTFMVKDLSPVDRQVRDLYNEDRADDVSRLPTIKCLLDACRPLMLVQKLIVRFRPRIEEVYRPSDGLANDYVRRRIESGSW